MKGKLTVLMITAFVDMLGLAMIIPLLPFYATKLGATATMVGLLVSAVAYVIFAYVSTLWLLLLSRVVQGLGGGTIGVVQAYVADASDPKNRAKSLGWLSAATSFGAARECSSSARCFSPHRWKTTSRAAPLR
jgi:MFS family permease